MDFYREYIYKLEDDHLNVYFCKDSCGSGLFHTIVLAKEKERIIGSGEHLCLSDRYTLSYSFPLDRKDPTFIIFCQVIGPRKDYTIETTFSRVSDEKKEPVLT